MQDIKHTISIKILLCIGLLTLCSLLAAANNNTRQPLRLTMHADTPAMVRLQPLYKHLMQNLRYPKQAREENVTGYVVAILYINESGAFTNAKIWRGIANGCDEEVRNKIVAFKDKMPTLKAGEYLLPVYFNMGDRNIKANIPPLPDDIKSNPNCLSTVIISGL